MSVRYTPAFGINLSIFLLFSNAAKEHPLWLFTSGVGIKSDYFFPPCLENSRCHRSLIMHMSFISNLKYVMWVVKNKLIALLPCHLHLSLICIFPVWMPFGTMLPFTGQSWYDNRLASSVMGLERRGGHFWSLSGQPHIERKILIRATSCMRYY